MDGRGWTSPQLLPTEKDINIHDSLDERAAVREFLGKDLKQAEVMFRRNFDVNQEHLMWMGPRAFCFYVDAAIAYLLSPEAAGHSDAARCFCGAVEYQVQHNGEAIAPARSRLRLAIQAMLSDFERYACDPLIHGDLASRYRRLQDQLV